MSAIYQIILKDQEGERVAQFDAFASLDYERQRNAPGWLKLELDLPDDRTELFELDGQIEIHRHGDWAGADWVVDFEAFHRRPAYRMVQSGQERFLSWGPGYLELLRSRIGLYWYYNDDARTSRGYLVLSGTPDEIIAGFVNYEAGSGAFYATKDRRCPGLAIGDVSTTGITITEQLRNKELLEAVQALAAAYNLDIRIVGIGAAQFEFQVGKLLGTDRRQGNPEMNPPVIFSTAYGNMERPQYIEDYLDEITAIYVGGQGEGEVRTIYELEEAARIAASPWNRREVFIDARDAVEETTLHGRALKLLQARGPIIDLTFSPIETEASKYGRDWNLGDLVTAIYQGVRRDYRIETIMVSVDNAGRETFALGLSEYVRRQPTFQSVLADIERRFRYLETREGLRPVSATLVVAADDSKNKARADYRCEATDNQEDIQRAIDALPV